MFENQLIVIIDTSTLKERYSGHVFTIWLLFGHNA